MDLTDYRYFEQLAQTLHFARSARALSMSPSALTRRVKAMEDELGQALVLREHRGVRLTAAGVRFRAFARKQIEQWEQLRSELQQDEAVPVGQLHIACTVTACHTVLPSLLGTFRDRYPGVTVHLNTQDAARSLSQLENGEVDWAVIPTDGEPPEQLLALPLATTSLAWIRQNEPVDPMLETGPESPLSVVAPLSGLERVRLDAWLKDSARPWHIVAEVRGNEGLIAMVSLGGGIALVPRLVLEASPLRERVREAKELVAPAGYQVSLCCKRRSLDRPIIRLFWELATSLSPKENERSQ